MIRKLRIIKIWYFGRLPLAKLFKKRIALEKVLAYCEKQNSIWGVFHNDPKGFEKALDIISLSLFFKSINR
jgi:hypothetical protein